MISRIFRGYGILCSSHPWEIIIVSLISLIYILSTSEFFVSNRVSTAEIHENFAHPAKTEIILYNLARCMALLCIYNQIKSLWRQQSTYILVIAAIYTIFSCFIYGLSVIYLLGGTFSDLHKAIPFFFLLIDLSKVGFLTKIALHSSSGNDIRDNIAHGMSEVGPSLTLDAIVSTLAISIGTLSDVESLEELSSYACLSAVINYFIGMTFLPSSLSLALELSRKRNKLLVTQLSVSSEKEQKLNPALQRVKVIMSAGLLLVHAHCRWVLSTDDNPGISSAENQMVTKGHTPSNEFETNNLDNFLLHYLNIGPDQLVILGLTLALVIKYFFYESHEGSLFHVADLIEPSSHPPETENAYDQRPCYSRLNSECTSENNSILSTMPDEILASYIKENFRNNRSISFIVSDNSGITDNETSSVGVQTDHLNWSDEKVSVMKRNEEEDDDDDRGETNRSYEDCMEILKSGQANLLSDGEIATLVNQKSIQAYKLESTLKDSFRGVKIRRRIMTEKLPTDALKNLPYSNYNYDRVTGACCENVLGYMPVPVGVAGPMLLDNVNYHVPMATTEGCLVASVNRGFRALLSGGGIRSNVVGDGMSRAPVVRCPSSQRSAQVMSWLQQDSNFQEIKSRFDSTSRFARLQKLHIRIAGRYLFIRFVAKTGDAMGMNMLSKGTEASLDTLQLYFNDVEVLSLSGNYCADKKPAAINWIEGRGKYVVCEAVVSEQIVKSVLKTTVQALIDVNISKNLIGSAVAGSLGGFNAQAANIVAAIFIATGQDPAQVVTSSNCMTLMEPAGPKGQDLYITVTMPSIEVGTIGGGTVLPAQASCLKMLNVQGSIADDPGKNAIILSSIVAGAVLAGELSLISALSSGHLVKSHMRLNRSNPKSSEADYSSGENKNMKSS